MQLNRAIKWPGGRPPHVTVCMPHASRMAQTIRVSKERRIPRMTYCDAVEPNGANSTATRTSVERKPPSELFDWLKQWYPAVVVNELDEKFPNAFTLMGRDLVLWKDKEGEWRCFQDCCPHRLAPLSEGRINEAGELHCNYHGWSFSGTGDCTHVPHLTAEETKLTQSKRACALSYPTKVIAGLLWVWGDGSPTRWVDSAANPIKHLTPELEEHGEAALLTNPIILNRGTFLGRWYRRDLPVSYTAAKSNAFNDPSHDTVLHHGMSSLDRNRAVPIEVLETKMTPEGYSVVSKQKYITRASDTSAFPAATRREFLPNPNGMSAVAYTTPMGLGKCRQFLGLFRDPTKELPPPTDFWSRLARKLPAQPLWLEHLVLHDVVDADLSMAYGQDVNRAKGVMKEYLPAAADSAPRLMMKWLDKYGSGGPPGSTQDKPTSPKAEMRPPREQLLDRWSQHTSTCPSCLGAYNNIHKLLSAAQLLLLVLVSAAAASLAVQGTAGPGLLLAVGAAAVGYAKVQLKALAQRFIFVDYGKEHPSKGP